MASIFPVTGQYTTFIMNSSQKALVELLRTGLNFLIWELCRTLTELYTSSPSPYLFTFSSSSPLFTASGWTVGLAFVAGLLLMFLVTGLISCLWAYGRRKGRTPLSGSTCIRRSGNRREDPASGQKLKSGPSGSTDSGRASRDVGGAGLTALRSLSRPPLPPRPRVFTPLVSVCCYHS